MEKNMALFLATLLHSGTNTHFMHWATRSYAQHKTLGKFYENIIELTDQLAEAYFGCYGQITSPKHSIWTGIERISKRWC
jgi:DNA-binding ferritin-like protein